MKKIFVATYAFIKKEAVFSIAAILAIVSLIVVKPGFDFVEGIDFRTLVLLFALMAVVAGLQRQSLFTRIGNALIERIESSRVMYLILVLICFVSSMVLTNDVALITFVPFSIMILPMAGLKKRIPIIVILQTIAANLGSALTPLGNPQNLYLYNISKMSTGEFILWMLPFWCISLVLVVVPIFFLGNEPIDRQSGHDLPKANMKKQILYLALFALCLLCVLKVLDYRILMAIVVICVAAMDRHTLLRVDYVLLLTFVGFFIFIYDMKQIPSVVTWISSVVSGREFLVGVLSSQIISNVPAAILLSGFTDNLKVLLLSVDAGGLGTLIASMASLISYKLYSMSKDSNSGKYMAKFTAFNVAYLVIIYLFCKMWYKI